MGWLFPLGLAALTLLALHRYGRCSRMALEIIAAGLLLAVAGYSWQGHPDMAGAVAAKLSSRMSGVGEGAN